MTHDEPWRCAGEGDPHPVQLEWVEGLPDFGSNSVCIERCRRCGLLYRHHWFDVNDWGAGGDYFSETHSWTPLADDELDTLRSNPAYQPRAEAAHRRQGRWQRS